MLAGGRARWGGGGGGRGLGLGFFWFGVEGLEFRVESFVFSCLLSSQLTISGCRWQKRRAGRMSPVWSFFLLQSMGSTSRVGDEVPLGGVQSFGLSVGLRVERAFQ